MSPLDPLGPLLAQIRSRAVGLKRGDAVQPRAHAPGEAAQAQSSSDLMGAVLAEVANLSPELPDRRRRAFRLFLRAVLARELAIEDRNAPSYDELVDDVLTSMEGDGRLRAAIEQAADALLQLARR